MIRYPRKITNLNAFYDGVSYAGLVMEAKLPVLKIMTAEHRGGGMDGPIAIDMGQEAMTAELTWAEHLPEIMAMVGRRATLVLRPVAPSARDPQDVLDYVVTLHGLWTTVEMDDLKPGQDAHLKTSCSVDRLKLEIGGEEVLFVDLPNFQRRVRGEDQLAAKRRAMGL
ncbi:MAG: phage major tail tube protein [Shimia sp.]